MPGHGKFIQDEASSTHVRYASTTGNPMARLSIEAERQHQGCCFLFLTPFKKILGRRGGTACLRLAQADEERHDISERVLHTKDTSRDRVEHSDYELQMELEELSHTYVRWTLKLFGV